MTIPKEMPEKWPWVAVATGSRGQTLGGTEEERRVKANAREYNEKFQYAKSKEDVSNFDPEFLKEEPVLTPIEEGMLSMINQEEFRNFSYTDPELQP